MDKIVGYVMLGGLIVAILCGLACVSMVAWRELRDLEDPVGGIGEESESEPEEGEARVWCKYDASRHCVDCEICAGEKKGGAE